MKLLTTSPELTNSLRGLMRRYEHYRWCVAWASSGFLLCDEFLKRQDRILQLVVGTHFYQTHPNFVEALIDHPAARFVLQPTGVFHPKIYLFENSPDDWACILGSPNFTSGAFSSNVEAAVYFDNATPAAPRHYKRLRSAIERQWRKGEKLNREQLQAYRWIWNRHAPRLQILAGTYGGSTKGRPLVKVELFGLGWPQFVARVRSEKHHSFPDRLRVLEAVRGYFDKNKCFAEMGMQRTALRAAADAER